MSIDIEVKKEALKVITALYGEVDQTQVQVQRTRKEFEGDYTLVVFPLLRVSRKSPEETAKELGEKIVAQSSVVKSYNVIKGFLNLSLNEQFWGDSFYKIKNEQEYGTYPSSSKTVMVEYSSPNTNKPLHLGHIRNNLLGYSVAEVLKANGHNVIKANLINDRGIHISKSMLAWKKWGEGETPQSSGVKGDHLVGKYYVEFDKHYKAEIKELMDKGGMSEEQAKAQAPSILEAQEMLRQWEAKDADTIALWEMMNGWVYEGFAKTYADMGVDFDKMYYESDTYLLGKKVVDEGLKSGVFYRREDGSVWIDLTDEGLDEKLLLRADGTSVYMTQDIGTAYQRFNENSLDEMIYVVGNEQVYHFQVLKVILSKLGNKWSDNIYHLSYGMVELPEGKMKSREGTVVDADDLIQEMISTAHNMSQELGKLNEATKEEADSVSRMVGLGALKYFLLRVDPKKNMLFDPTESIDFNGNTAPFIQYTHARIRSVLRRAEQAKISYGDALTNLAQNLTSAEIEIIKELAEYPVVVKVAGEEHSPAIIAAYIYELAKLYNGYYHNHQILREENESSRVVRLQLSEQVGRVIKRGMNLLGIDVPERM